MKQLILNKFAIITACVAILAPAASTQDTVLSLNLKQAQDYALANNLKRKNAALDVDIAKKKVWETTAQGLPQVSAGVDFQYILNDLPKLTFPGQNGQPIEIEVGEKANATYSISVSQLVFNGPYIVGLQAARAYKAMSEQALAKTDQEIKANVAAGYLTVLLLQETTSIMDSSLENLRRIALDTEQLHKNGFADRTGVDQLKVSVSLLENSSVETRKQLNTATRLLKLQLGLPDSANLILSDNLKKMIDSYNPLNQSVQFDANRNIDLKILDNQVTINKLQLKLNQSYFLPSISAFVSFQRLHKEPQINFTPKALLGAKLTLPIFSCGMRLSKVQQAKLELNKSINTYNEVRQSVEMDFADARANLSVAWSKYETQSKNRELAYRVLEEIKIKHKNGLASQQDVIQANDKHLQAVGNYLAAIVDLINAKVRLDKITGNI